MSLSDDIQNCTKCRLSEYFINKLDISKGYGKLVGNGGSEIFLIAQNPSINRYPNLTSAMGVENEIIRGGGDRFRKMLKDIGIDSSRIYWTNLVKCSTHDNQKPSDDIIRSCLDWLIKEIDEMKPNKVIAMGAVAYTSLHNMKVLNKSHMQYIWHYSYVFNHKRNLMDEYIKQLLRAFNDK